MELPAQIQRDQVETIEVKVGYPKASSLELFCYGESLGKCVGEAGTISVAAELGLGPVPLRLVASLENRSIGGPTKIITLR
jgi:hypothetical protein